MARIDRIYITAVRIPLDKEVHAPGMPIPFCDYIIVALSCDDGSNGTGFSYIGTGGARAAALAAEELLVRRVIGVDPYDTDTAWDRMYYQTLIQGRAGLVMNGLSAIDITLWDRKARAAGMPLHRYPGGTTDQSAPAYASGG